MAVKETTVSVVSQTTTTALIAHKAACLRKGAVVKQLMPLLSDILLGLERPGYAEKVPLWLKKIQDNRGTSD